MTTEGLTPEERDAIEGSLGAGMVEIGGPWQEDDPIVTGCRKLGLNPTDWHGNPVLPEKRA